MLIISSAAKQAKRLKKKIKRKILKQGSKKKHKVHYHGEPGLYLKHQLLEPNPNLNLNLNPNSSSPYPKHKPIHYKQIPNGTRAPFHFRFRVRILRIAPWPRASTLSSFFLRWHRGDRHTGTTKIVPSSADGVLYFIDESFDLPVTLYYTSASAPGFQQKLIFFTLLDARNPNGPPVACSSLNLAAYAASNLEEDRSTTACIPLTIPLNSNFGGLSPNLHVSFVCSLHQEACLAVWHRSDITKYLPTQFSLNSPCTSMAVKDPASARFVHARNAASGASSSRTPNLSADDEDDYNYIVDEINGKTKRSSADFEDEANAEASAEEDEDEEVEIEDFTDEESLHDHIINGADDAANTIIEERSEPITEEANTTHISEEDKALLEVALDASELENSSESPLTEFRTVEDENVNGGHSSDAKLEDSTPSSCASHEITEASDRTPGEIIKSAVTSDNQEIAAQQDEVKNVVNETQQIDSSNTLNATENKITTGRSSSFDERRHSKRGFPQLFEHKVWKLTLEDLSADMDDLDKTPDSSASVLEEARQKFEQSAEIRNEQIEKRMMEDAKIKLSEIDGKLSEALDRESALKGRISRLEAELQSVAAIETVIHCTDPQHGDSVLEPAYNLSRFHKHAIKNWSREGSESLMKNTVSALILVAQACGQDISRLMFWWSNVLSLRHVIMMEFSCTDSALEESNGVAPLETTEANEYHESHSKFCDEINTFVTAMEKLESWIFSKVMESIWVQVFAPKAQKQEAPTPAQQDQFGRRRNSSITLEQKDGVEPNVCIDTWKKVLLTTLQRLCPARFAGKQCCCVFGLNRLVIENCIARLDASIFNAILPIDHTEVPTDAIVDTVHDIRFLPILPGSLSLTSGAQIKNVVSSWSTWLTLLMEKLSSTGNTTIVEDENRLFIPFPVLKSVADLLMLPREMITDKSVRKEVCPALSLPVIVRILSNVQPDELSPDPIPPSVLAAINAEIAVQKRMYGPEAVQSNFSEDGVAFRPRVVYSLQSSTQVMDSIRSDLLPTLTSWISASTVGDSMLGDLQSLLLRTLNVSDEMVSTSTDQCYEHTDDLLEYANQLQTTKTQDPLQLLRFKLLQEIISKETTLS